MNNGATFSKNSVLSSVIQPEEFHRLLSFFLFHRMTSIINTFKISISLLQELMIEVNHFFSPMITLYSYNVSSLAQLLFELKTDICFSKTHRHIIAINYWSIWRYYSRRLHSIVFFYLFWALQRLLRVQYLHQDSKNHISTTIDVNFRKTHRKHTQVISISWSKVCSAFVPLFFLFISR